MRCKEIRRYFSAYMDGELRREEVDEMRVHLESCRECSEAFQRLERAWCLLLETPVPRMEPGFYMRLRARMKYHPPRRVAGWTGRVLVPVAMAIVFLLGIFLGSLMGRYPSGITPVPQESGEEVYTYLENLNDFSENSLAGAYTQLASVK
jgi:anti-sigma factor RsiW